MKKSLLLIACLFFIAKGITYAQSNLLLGMTANGGTNNTGVIFKINYDGSGFKVLHSFVSAAGRNPYGNLIRATNGLFYGTADSGGSKKGGVIFSFDTATNKYTDVFNFGTTDARGCYPGCTLLQANDGKLYGMTAAGGTNNLGVLFKFNPANNGYTKLIDFIGTNGATPYHNSLIQASNGALYGLTVGGGPIDAYGYYDGVLFSFNPINNTYSSYNASYEAANPNGRLIEGNDGQLYGTTLTSVSACNEGTLIRFDPVNAGNIDVAYQFSGGCHGTNGPHGLYPYGSLIQPSPGTYYGMNSGSSDGIHLASPNIFKFESSNATVTELFKFKSSANNGNLPYGSLLAANDGNLYGMTWSGGAHDFGVIFRFNPDDNTYLKIHDFDGVHGANPYADLITIPICILPARPGGITGNFLFCPGSTQTYTIAPVAGATSYKWTVPAGSSIQGAKTGVSIKVLMGNKIGSITVWAKNACGISRDSSAKVLAIHCTTFTEAQAHISFTADISPNPTTGNLTLQFNSSAKDNYSVKVVDIVGNRVLNMQGIADPGLNTIHLDLSKFAKGVYILALDEGNNKKLITKIVLQ